MTIQTLLIVGGSIVVAFAAGVLVAPRIFELIHRSDEPISTAPGRPARINPADIRQGRRNGGM